MIVRRMGSMANVLDTQDDPVILKKLVSLARTNKALWGRTLGGINRNVQVAVTS